MRHDRHIQEARERIAYEAGEAADREWADKWARGRLVRFADAFAKFVERRWLALILVGSAIVAASLMAGCATTNTPTGREVKVSEAKGGVIARAISMVTRQDVDAFTLPTRPPTTVLLRDADDPGLRCHEEQHRTQILKLGHGEFVSEYVKELARVGYWDNWLEVDARAAQAVCDYAAANGGP